MDVTWSVEICPADHINNLMDMQIKGVKLASFQIN